MIFTAGVIYFIILFENFTAGYVLYDLKDHYI